MRVLFFDQGDLPVATPALDAFFSGDGVSDQKMWLEPDESIDAILAGEAGSLAALVLEHPPNKIICDTAIERAVSLRSEQINKVAVHHNATMGCACLIVIPDGCPAKAGRRSGTYARASEVFHDGSRRYAPDQVGGIRPG